jgi:hypothetical protein
MGWLDGNAGLLCPAAIALPLALAFERLWPLSPDQLIRSGISSLTQGSSYLLSTKKSFRIKEFDFLKDGKGNPNPNPNPKCNGIPRSLAHKGGETKDTFTPDQEGGRGNWY